MTKDRSEREIIDEAYSDEAAATWKAPVQGYPGGIPWPIHLEAYEAYCKRWGKQTALIDLKGRGCRGGFGTEELDGFVPGWRDRVTRHGRTYAYACELLKTLMTKHFPEAAPPTPLPDTMGVLTQIDNLTTALVRGKPGVITSRALIAMLDDPTVANAINEHGRNAQ